MKVLYIINKMTNLAGIERILTCKMNYLSEHTSHQIILTTYEQGRHPISFPTNDKILHISFDVTIPEREGSSFIGWLIRNMNARHKFKHEFRKILNTIQPDIVIATGYAFPVLDIIINTSHKAGAKTIMESHVQGETVSMTKYIYNSTLKRLFSFWDQRIMNSLKRCNCIVTLTNGDVSYWKNYAPQIEVIPNLLTVEPKPVKDYATKRVICAGRYAPQKGFDLLLDAWRQLNRHYSDWQLYIFGNGDRSPYQKIVDYWGLGSSVHLMNATPNIVDEFTQSSIYVMSSRFEGFGLVLAEAMACGLPCVSFDCPHGPRDIISDGEDGLLVENGNTKALAEKIQFLMSKTEIRQVMGEKAAKNIARYEPKIIMNQWCQLFNDI